FVVPDNNVSFTEVEGAVRLIKENGAEEIVISPWVIYEEAIRLNPGPELSVEDLLNQAPISLKKSTPFGAGRFEAIAQGGGPPIEIKPAEDSTESDEFDLTELPPSDDVIHINPHPSQYMDVILREFNSLGSVDTSKYYLSNLPVDLETNWQGYYRIFGGMKVENSDFGNLPYPEWAGNQIGNQVSTGFLFTIDSLGKVLEITNQRSSGNNDWDNEVRKVLERCTFQSSEAPIPGQGIIVLHYFQPDVIRINPDASVSSKDILNQATIELKNQDTGSTSEGVNTETPEADSTETEETGDVIRINPNAAMSTEEILAQAPIELTKPVSSDTTITRKFEKIAQSVGQPLQKESAEDTSESVEFDLTELSPSEDVIRINPPLKRRVTLDTLKLDIIPEANKTGELWLHMGEDGSFLFSFAYDSFSVETIASEVLPLVKRDSVLIRLTAYHKTPSAYVMDFISTLQTEGFHYVNVSYYYDDTLLVALPGVTMRTDSLTGEVELGLVVGDSTMFLDLKCSIYLKETEIIEVNSEEIDEADLSDLINALLDRSEDKAVIVRADGDVNWGKVTEMLQTSKKAGAERFFLVKGKPMEAE
ncbi:hypothetical protein GF359_02145, partial [candidate division WOR-3 bacterium]|nr:hypothetical protein [candidate division WOR-3 bacterium]MBD3363994.1 hypothetical protein [candidate division WOR-3 bacterium]